MSIFFTCLTTAGEFCSSAESKLQQETPDCLVCFGKFLKRMEFNRNRQSLKNKLFDQLPIGATR
jgi:hypothetical protein